MLNYNPAEKDLKKSCIAKHNITPKKLKDIIMSSSVFALTYVGPFAGSGGIFGTSSGNSFGIGMMKSSVSTSAANFLGNSGSTGSLFGTSSAAFSTVALPLAVVIALFYGFYKLIDWE